MAEYKARRARKRASGGKAGEGKAGPLHGHMIIMIGLAKKPKKKAGGKVEGGAARRHLGKRARGGPADGPRVLDAREDAREPGPNGRDKVPQQSGTEERAVEMGDPRKRGGHVTFRTPSGGVSAGARREAEGKGDAMAGGRFPIRNASDLSNAKHAFGRANDKPAVKRWINKRASDLGEPPLGGE
jgi:hypothetical protein